jgi:hypothetical protein
MMASRYNQPPREKNAPKVKIEPYKAMRRLCRRGKGKMKQVQNTLTRADVAAILSRLLSREYARATADGYRRALADVSEQADAMFAGTFYRDADAIPADDPAAGA